MNYELWCWISHTFDGWGLAWCRGVFGLSFSLRLAFIEERPCHARVSHLLHRVERFCHNPARRKVSWSPEQCPNIPCTAKSPNPRTAGKHLKQKVLVADWLNFCEDCSHILKKKKPNTYQPASWTSRSIHVYLEHESQMHSHHTKENLKSFKTLQLLCLLNFVWWPGILMFQFFFFNFWDINEIITKYTPRSPPFHYRQDVIENSWKSQYKAGALGRCADDKKAVGELNQIGSTYCHEVTAVHNKKWVLIRTTCALLFNKEQPEDLL